MPTIVAIVLDISLGAIAIGLYQRVGPLLTQTTELVKLMDAQLRNHEVRLSALEARDSG